MQLEFLRLRFHFTAQATIHFPPGRSGNMLRGAFGAALRHTACTPACKDARMCATRSACAYARLFEPSADGPSGLTDPPRPFVFRTRHLDGCRFAAGASFFIDLHLFDLRDGSNVEHFTRAFAQLGQTGLGPERAAATFTGVEAAEPCRVNLDPLPEAPDRVTVQFLTPTELKSGGEPVAHPEFGVLLSRIRDRLNALSVIYGPGPLEIDFAGFGQRAASIRMTRCDIRSVESSRVSARTGQRHSIGGFVGSADYEGDLREFIPYLNAAQFTGVGRQTTWGKGEIQATP